MFQLHISDSLYISTGFSLLTGKWDIIYNRIEQNKSVNNSQSSNRCDNYFKNSTKCVVTKSWKTYLLGTLVGLLQSSISPRKKKVLVWNFTARWFDSCFIQIWFIFKRLQRFSFDFSQRLLVPKATCRSGHNCLQRSWSDLVCGQLHINYSKWKET